MLDTVLLYYHLSILGNKFFVNMTYDERVIPRT